MIPQRMPVFADQLRRWLVTHGVEPDQAGPLALAMVAENVVADPAEPPTPATTTPTNWKPPEAT